MKLFFQNSKGTRRCVGIFNSMTDAIKEIHKFCEERGFKIYYTRRWKDDNGDMWFDVGSHTEFFVVTEIIEGENSDGRD